MIKKTLMIMAVGFLALSLGSLSRASDADLPLMATKGHPQASGMAHFSDNSLKIDAKGLRPNEVYTVWFVNMKPEKHEAGAGSPPYTFRTDSNGNGAYEADISEHLSGNGRYS